MPSFVTIPDPPAGPGATGRVRTDHRRPEAPAGRPPLVLLGGMTQTLSSWGGQLRPLSATREVLVYEARGQGQSELSLADCGLTQQADDLAALVEALGLETPVDLCGFSFGGRVCLSTAARHPDLVRRLVLTGVGAARGVVGRIIIEGWLASLDTGDLRALAWISMADILGPKFLEKHEDMLEAMVEAVVHRNTFEGIEALFTQTFGEGRANDAHAPLKAARSVQAPALLLGGSLDRIAPPAEVATLADALGAEHHTIDDVGHTVAIEAPELWRREVLAFLDQD